MKRADVNTDQERARKRAKADGRTALRKLGLLQRLADLQAHGYVGTCPPSVEELVSDMLEALAVTEADR